MNSPDIFSAALAGLLSFLSPCVLPLIPAYLSFVSGSTVSALSTGADRGRVFARSLGFSAGFTLAFTILGIVFSGGAMFVGGGGASKYIGIAGGLLVVVLGLNLIFDFIKFLGADSRLIGRFSGKKSAGISSAFFLGLAFAAGWSPCIGPILASILLFAGREGNIPRAAALLFSYSLGFAIPFLATGLFFDRLKPLLSFFSRHGNVVRIVSGIVLVVFGAAMTAGGLGSLSGIASRAGYGLGAFAGKEPGISAAIGAVFWLSIAAAFAAPVFFRGISKISRRRRIAAVLGGGAGAALAVAELLGAFSTLSIVARWLTFAGI